MTNKSIYLLSSNGTWAKLEIEDLNLAQTTFSIADIEKITARNDNFTENITILGTKLNNQILGNVSNLNSYNNPNSDEQLYANFNINGEVDCLYYENDSLITKGLFKVNEVKTSKGFKTYSCTITGYRINFYTKLNDKLLSDLDFSEYNHAYSINNITNSWNTSIIRNGSSVPFQYGRGYVYGFADYGTSIYADKERTLNDISFKDFRPSFYLKEYLDKIFAQDVLNGFSYSIEGSTEFKEMFNRLVVPNNADVMANYGTERLLAATKNNSQTFLTGDKQYVHDDVSNSNLYKIGVNWTNVSLNTGVFELNAQPYIDYSNNVFIATRSVSTSVEVSSGVRFETFFPRNGHSEDVIDATCTLHIVTRPNGSSGWSKIASSEPQRIHTDGENWGTGVYTFKVKTNLSLQSGAQMMIVYEFTDYHKEWRGPIPLYDYFMSAILVGNNTYINIGDGTSNSKTELELNDSVDFKNLQSLNTYKQQDFILSLQNLFNLYVWNDIDNPKHIYFEPYNDYYRDCLVPNIKTSSLNWSKKLDYSSTLMKPFQKIYKNYKFQYKEDNDYLNLEYKNKYGSVYGNYTYTNKNTSLTTDNAIELIFASTPVFNYINSNRILPLFFNYDNNNYKVPKQTVIRLLFYNGLKLCDSYNIGRWHRNDDGGWGFDVYAPSRTSYPQLHTTYDVTGVDLNFNKPDEIRYTYSDEPKYIYPEFYQNQVTEYNDSNTITYDAQVLLTEIDIANLSFRKPIYFDSPDGDGFFKLVNVNYGNNTKTSDVTFQRIYLADSYTTSTYYNNAINGFVTNSSCTVSESIFINVPAGKYSSTSSQQAADVQAQAEYNQLELIAEGSAICISVENVFNLSYRQTTFAACSLVPDDVEYYTSTGTLDNGSIIFKKVDDNYIRCGLGYYSDTTTWYLLNQNGEITSSGLCADIDLNSSVLSFHPTKQQACLNAEQGLTMQTYYYPSYLTVGEFIYTDAEGSIPVGEGFYSDAFYCYNTTADGQINDQLLC